MIYCVGSSYPNSALASLLRVFACIVTCSSLSVAVACSTLYALNRARDDGQFRVSGYSEFRIPNYYQTPKTRTVTPSHGTQPKSRPFSHTETANRVFKWYKKGHGHERHIGVPKLKTGGVVVHIGLIPYKSAGK